MRNLSSVLQIQSKKEYAYSSIINSPAKKLKLTQKVNNVHLFQFTVCPLFNSLFGGHVFSIIIIIIIIIKKLSLDCREF